MYIDENTNTEQQRELEAIMHGKKGGLMEVVSGLVSTYVPTQITTIDVQEENGTITATIGNVGQIRSERLKN